MGAGLRGRAAGAGRPAGGAGGRAAIRPASADHPVGGRKDPGSGTMESAVVVLGATGVIGRGVVQAVLEAGRPVVAVALERHELEQLQVSHPDADIVAL